MQKPIFFLILSLFTIICKAENISLQDAMAKAAALRDNQSKVTKAMARVLGNTDDQQSIRLSLTRQIDGNTLYYVFNYPEGGFAIIGGNDAAKEVLGYSSEGTFDEACIPEGLQDILLSYQEQITDALQRSADLQTVKAMQDRKSVAPMIKTKWGQSEPYNSAIPNLGDWSPKFVTGCNATAAAQLMYYYKYPKQGVSEHAYQINYNGTNLMTFSADFAATSYDWENMRTEYRGEYSSEQADAVATLMYHLGVAMDMQYNVKSIGSGSLTTACASALTQYFGYDKGATFEQRCYYDDFEWEQMIYDELRLGHPVIYGGQSSTGGHAFVCHGYDAETNCFLINWGWEGNCDGYFSLTGTNALIPNGTGIGGGAVGSSYASEQSAFIGLVPDRGTSDYTHSIAFVGDVMFADGTHQKVVDLNEGENLDLQINSTKSSFLNAGYMNPGGFYVGVMLEDIHTGRQYAQYTTIPISFHTSLAPCTGTYRVLPAYRFPESDSWHKMLVEKQYTVPTLTIQNGYGDNNHDGHVSIADLISVLKNNDKEQTSKLIKLLLQSN